MHHQTTLRVGGSVELIDVSLEAVSSIVGEHVVAAVRAHIAEAQQQYLPPCGYRGHQVDVEELLTQVGDPGVVLRRGGFEEGVLPA